MTPKAQARRAKIKNWFLKIEKIKKSFHEQKKQSQNEKATYRIEENTYKPSI